MKPLLGPDVYFVPAEKRVYAYTTSSVSVLKGDDSLYPWLERIVPHLSGDQTVEELCDGLSGDRRQAVETIIGALHERGLVRDRGAGEPARATGDPELRFVEHFRSSATRDLRAYRRTPAVVVGGGALARAWELAARESGMTRVSRVADEQSLSEAVGSADLVVHLSGRPAVERALTLERLCRHAGRTLVQAIRVDDAVWIVPPAVRWYDVWRRYRALGGTRDAGPSPLTPAARTLIGNQVALLCLRELTGFEPETRARRLDLNSLRTTTHEVLPHPWSQPATEPPEGEFMARIEALSTGKRLTEEEVSRRSVRCYDEYVGVFGALSEQDFVQVPLHVTRATVSDPAGSPERAGEPGAVVAAGLDFTEVRHAANRLALESYAAAVGARRRFGTAASGEVWAYDLADRKARLVPAAEVFPGPDGRAGAPAPSAVGSGLDWPEAVTAGLVAACRSVCVSAIATRTIPYPEVDLDTIGLDEAGTRLRRVLRIGEQDGRLYDIGGELGVPTFACCLGAETVAYTCAPDPARAARAGLLALVQAYQAKSNGQAAYAPAPVPPLPEGLRGTRARGFARQGPVDILDALVAAGHRPAVVPLDHDPAVCDILPYLARVVLAR